jgi:hypothetical protein
MSVKPVDFQVMIPRTMDAAKVRSDEMQKHLAQQQQQAASLHNKAEDTLKQVYSRSEAQEARINEKQQENSQQNDKKKKSGKQGQASNSRDGRKPGDAIRTSTIDIKI